MDIRVISIIKKGAKNIYPQSLLELMLSFLLGEYLGIEWLDHMVGICLIFKETAKHF